MLTLLSIGTLTLASSIQPIRAEREQIHIRADGSVYPSTYPISSVDNITYTLTGNISGIEEIDVERDNIVIDGEGHTLEGCGVGATGISLLHTKNVTVRNTKIQGFHRGIWLTISSNNCIVGNKLANNLFGIDFYGSWFYGTYLHYSFNNSIVGNTIANNEYGLYFTYSPDNTIVGNTIANNRLGVWLYQASSNNKFYHNNFIKNTEQAPSAGYTNLWDDGYPSGGNYWSDYNGTDMYSGLYQNESGNDGIGDTPYAIYTSEGVGGINIDHYPLMNPWYPVGGICTYIPVNKPEPLTPYIIASTILVLTAIIAIYAKRKLE